MSSTLSGPAGSSEKKVLCSVETITSIRKHNNADRLYVARVCGYDVIITPETFGVQADCTERLIDTKGVMIFVDAVLPESMSKNPVFSYLSDSHMGKRVRTVKIRGEYSQGMFLPVFFVKELFPELSERLNLPGSDLTQEMGIQKFYAQDDRENPMTRERLLAPFPEMIPKTDQPHLQKMGEEALEEMKNRLVVATLKIDGQSGTFFYDPESKTSGMCSRNFRILLDEDGKNPDSSQFIFVEKKYQILEKLRGLNRPLAIQGELYGEGINGNRLQMGAKGSKSSKSANGEKETYFAVFGIYEWEPDSKIDTENGSRYTGKYLSHDKMIRVCTELQIPYAPIVIDKTPFSEVAKNIDEWTEKACQLTYDSVSPKKGLLAEGMVVKTVDEFSYVSFKIISRAYLAKHGL